LQQYWWLSTDIQQYGMHLDIFKTIFFLLEKGVEPHFSVHTTLYSFVVEVFCIRVQQS